MGITYFALKIVIETIYLQKNTCWSHCVSCKQMALRSYSHCFFKFSNFILFFFYFCIKSGKLNVAL